MLLALPPLGAFFCFALSRAFSMGVEGRNVSRKTRERQRFNFWLLLLSGWALMALVLAIGDFRWASAHQWRLPL